MGPGHALGAVKARVRRELPAAHGLALGGRLRVEVELRHLVDGRRRAEARGARVRRARARVRRRRVGEVQRVVPAHLRPHVVADGEGRRRVVAPARERVLQEAGVLRRGPEPSLEHVRRQLQRELAERRLGVGEGRELLRLEEPLRRQREGALRRAARRRRRVVHLHARLLLERLRAGYGGVRRVVCARVGAAVLPRPGHAHDEASVRLRRPAPAALGGLRSVCVPGEEGLRAAVHGLRHHRAILSDAVVDEGDDGVGRPRPRHLAPLDGRRSANDPRRERSPSRAPPRVRLSALRPGNADALVRVPSRLRALLIRRRVRQAALGVVAARLPRRPGDVHGHLVEAPSLRLRPRDAAPLRRLGA
mmetsp:Transcript_44684/g.140115  ORF Transcript_44684/g.140115 Transcript_44684/m.140115 type:complete len:363 (+) Transcript_44684:1935-3023(+)